MNKTQPTLSECYPIQSVSFCPACGAQQFSPDLQPIDSASYTYPHSYTCGSCGFTFFINAAASTMALIRDDAGSILMLRRMREPKKGTLDLPGGFIAPGERAEAGMKREVLEETNLKIEIFHLWNRTYCNAYFYGGVLYQTLDLVFICTVSDWSRLRPNDPQEGIPVLIPASQLDPGEVGLDSVREFLTDYLRS